MRRPTTILFDYGATLLRETRLELDAGRQRILDLAHNPRGVTLTEYKDTLKHLLVDIEPVQRAASIEFSARTLGRLIFALLGLSFDVSEEDLEEEFWRAAIDMAPEPGLRDMLDALKGEGFALGIISNTVFSRRVLHNELCRHGLDHYFDHLLASSEYGLRKPHPALFFAAARLMNAAADDIWYIGDSETNDVIGAQDCGMTGLWYFPGEASPKKSEPDAIVRHWDELTKLVKSP
ncbi:MAG: HAD family hydrolase [Candidatus Hydrogenedentes bacterium]|nr:HAD family hydrolase [Candidatus Hydrogenedentota bacterium]